MQYSPLTLTDTSPLILAILGAVLVLAVISDLRTNRIPNTLTVPGVGLMLAALLWSFSLSTVGDHLLSLVVTLVVFGLLFRLGAMGGGDVKLMLVVGLAFPLSALISLWLWIFVIGGLQALVTRFVFRKKALPYGVAIGVGTLGYVVSSFVMLG